MLGEVLSHLDEKGEARLVDVGGKALTMRQAAAQASLRMQPATLRLILAGGLPKGDVFAVAKIAGIMGAKKTADLIPLCHPLALDSIDLTFTACPPDRVIIRSRIGTTGRTGVEMEALTAVSVAALTLYDMVKAVDREMAVEEICLLEKTGGRSGRWLREGSADRPDAAVADHQDAAAADHPGAGGNRTDPDSAESAGQTDRERL